MNRAAVHLLSDLSPLAVKLTMPFTSMGQDFALARYNNNGTLDLERFANGCTVHRRGAEVIEISLRNLCGLCASAVNPLA